MESSFRCIATELCRTHWYAPATSDRHQAHHSIISRLESMQVLLNMPPEHQDTQHSGYIQSNWMNVASGYSSSPQTTISPMQEFPQFDYHTTTPMPMEPAYSMPRPSPFATSHAPMPPPLIMPHSGLWPSMLASQPQSAYQTPILPAGPLQTPLSASTTSDITPTSAKTNTSRRKLTDDERRQMCIEAEQNPTMKQTQIGGMWPNSFF